MDKRYPYCKFTIIEEKQIIEDYKNGNSLAVVGKRWGCDPSTVKNILKAYNELTRNYSQARRNSIKSYINESVFEDINNPNSAYWLGVMYSDGYITKGPYTKYFGITISDKDAEWLEKFRQFLQCSNPVKYFTQKTTYGIAKTARLLIGNNKIVEDLEKHGMVERKTTLISKLPNTSYLDDFIRGYIDGDGSLLKRAACLAISGNYPFLMDIANYFGLPYKIYKDKSIYSLQYNAKESHYLEQRLYQNAHYYLDRKYQIASRSFNSPIILENIDENLEYQGKSLES